MTTVPVYPVQPFPAVRKQSEIDRAVLANYRSSHVYGYDYSNPDRGSRRYQALSFIEWQVLCRFCKAEVDEPCKGGRTYLHQVRAKDHQALVRGRVDNYRVYLPDWAHRWRLRTEQRRLIVSLEAHAYNQTLSNRALDSVIAEAAEMGVDPAMIKRAVGQGHQRARRRHQKTADYQELQRQNRVRRALEGLDNKETHQ